MSRRGRSYALYVDHVLQDGIITEHGVTIVEPTNLDAILDRVDNGELSYSALAAHLYAEYDISVTGETLRRWNHGQGWTRTRPDMGEAS